MTLSADLPLEICYAISLFLMATHPLGMVNHPKEDSIWILHPLNDQDDHIYCGFVYGFFCALLVFPTGFVFQLSACVLFYLEVKEYGLVGDLESEVDVVRLEDHLNLFRCSYNFSLLSQQ